MLPSVPFQASQALAAWHRGRDLVAETLVVRAEISELARVRDWTDSLGQRFALPQSTLFAIQLCFEEALSNIVRHGFAGSRDEVTRNKDVHLALERADDRIIVTIEDHGVAFDPLGVAAPDMPTAISEAPAGGRGIHLMRQFAQCLAYERRDGVNRLTLRFTYPTALRSHAVLT
jgi:anti-sigma regulatory factor (Ser/Thr protein kinase)